MKINLVNMNVEVKIFQDKNQIIFLLNKVKKKTKYDLIFDFDFDFLKFQKFEKSNKNFIQKK